MWKDLWLLSLQSPDFAWIFSTAILILGFKTAVKYITKLPVFLKEPPDPTAKKAAHFECLRLGLDLSFLGLVAGFAVFRLALKGAEQAQIFRLATLEPSFIFFQLFLIGWAVFFTTVFHSPEKSFQRGIWIPSIIGFLSVYSSALVFKFLMSKVG